MGGGFEGSGSKASEVQGLVFLGCKTYTLNPKPCPGSKQIRFGFGLEVGPLHGSGGPKFRVKGRLGLKPRDPGLECASLYRDSGTMPRQESTRLFSLWEDHINS